MMSELVGIWLEAVQESAMVLGVSRNEQAGPNIKACGKF